MHTASRRGGGRGQPSKATARPSTTNGGRRGEEKETAGVRGKRASLSASPPPLSHSLRGHGDPCQLMHRTPTRTFIPHARGVIHSQDGFELFKESDPEWSAPLAGCSHCLCPYQSLRTGVRRMALLTPSTCGPTCPFPPPISPHTHSPTFCCKTGWLPRHDLLFSPWDGLPHLQWSSGADILAWCQMRVPRPKWSTAPHVEQNATQGRAETRQSRATELRAVRANVGWGQTGLH